MKIGTILQLLVLVALSAEESNLYGVIASSTTKSQKHDRRHAAAHHIEDVTDLLEMDRKLHQAQHASLLQPRHPLVRTPNASSSSVSRSSRQRYPSELNPAAPGASWRGPSHGQEGDIRGGGWSPHRQNLTATISSKKQYQRTDNSGGGGGGSSVGPPKVVVSLAAAAQQKKANKHSFGAKTLTLDYVVSYGTIRRQLAELHGRLGGVVVVVVAMLVTDELTTSSSSQHDLLLPLLRSRVKGLLPVGKNHTQVFSFLAALNNSLGMGGGSGGDEGGGDWTPLEEEETQAEKMQAKKKKKRRKRRSRRS